nr:DNA (cytosine-5)-methyltransferase 3B isoform X2 [Parasteatoda tepidariorum]
MSSTKRKNNESLLSQQAISATTIPIGCVVWVVSESSGDKEWWPAITLRFSDCYQKPPEEDHTWIYWFADYKISKVSVQDIIEFTAGYADLIGRVIKETHLKAVNEALEMLAQRSNLDYQNIEELTNWAKSDFEGIIRESNDVPDMVLKKLERNDLGKGFSEDESKGNSGVPIFEKIENGLIDIEKMCIACRKEDAEVKHPFFKGGLCIACKENWMQTIFAIGDDGKNFYCLICGNLGNLVLCDKENCEYSYCLSCIDVFLGDKRRKKILETSPWLCFFCSKIPGTFEKRENWEEELHFMFESSASGKTCYPLKNTPIRPIRVLSLFDGIGTGKLVLDNLGIDVEVYYASEIDEAALCVSKLQHPDAIEYIGDVTKLLSKKISSMCPIDLLIGGSPCNDLSLVNPLRKGLFDVTGTGCLFFDYYHILKTVKRFNKDRHLFYLFENVAAMTKANRQIISQFLSCSPALIDAKYCSPQSRPRFFWGNIPGLHAHSRICYSYDDERHELESCLHTELGRKAKVNKIKTVTTKKNSLSDMPVEMKGIPDILWITELERVFGFPMHYTDVGNLSPTKRQELLGRSWSVPVITQILNPLQKLFKKSSV